MAKKKAGSKKRPVKKPARKAAAKKVPAKKRTPQKKAAAKASRRPAKKAAPKRAAAKKAAPKKTAAKKAAPKRRARVAPKPKSAPARRAVPVAKPKARTQPPPFDLRRDREVTEPFLDRPAGGRDDLAEELGESYVQSATSGEESALELQNEETEEERGGPFVVTTAAQEFADDVDESNPEDAEPAALPTVMASEADDEEE